MGDDVMRLRTAAEAVELRALLRDVIEQLTEAIAQRDEALERTKLLDNARERWGDDAALSWHTDTQQWAAHHRKYDHDVRIAQVERQLAAKRARVDEFVDVFREVPLPADRAWTPLEQAIHQLIADHDAHRAAEHSDG